MQDWKRRQWLRTVGLSSLGLSLASFEEAGAAPEAEEQIYRLLYNENPHGPSEKARQMIGTMTGRSNRYATFHEFDYLALKKLIAAQEGLTPGHVLLGHGSFELLTWLAVHYTRSGGEIVVPSPSFDVVGAISRKIGGKVNPVEVNRDFQLDLTAMRQKLTKATTLLTLCNPNNPTGRQLDTGELTKFCEEVSAQIPILVDEAYIHYLDKWQQHSMASLLKAGHNVLISRTFSKIYGMAGLRIGFLLGQPALIKELEAKFTMGFPGNMPNGLSVAAAIGALQDGPFLDKSRTRNQDGKDRLYRAFEKLEIPFLESTANFVYFDVTNFPAFRTYMRKNNIILAGGWPTKVNWGRVTIGTEAEMSYFTGLLENKPWL